MHRWQKDNANLPWLLLVLDDADALDLFYPSENASTDEIGLGAQYAPHKMPDTYGTDHLLALAKYNELDTNARFFELSDAEESHSKPESGFRKLHGPGHPDYFNVLIDIGSLHERKEFRSMAGRHFPSTRKVMVPTMNSSYKWMSCNFCSLRSRQVR